jgi:hypothetical protein
MGLAAILAAFTAFNQFLVTPPGQVLTANANGVVAKVLNGFGAHLEAAGVTQAAQPAPAAAASAAQAGSVADAFAALKKAPEPTK